MVNRPMRVVEVPLPVTLDDSLNQLVTISGVSKRSLIHASLVAFLGPLGVLSPTDAEDITLTQTRGSLRTKPRKA